MRELLLSLVDVLDPVERPPIVRLFEEREEEEELPVRSVAVPLSRREVLSRPDVPLPLLSRRESEIGV